MTLASDKRAALRFAQVRGWLAVELPKGIPGSRWYCPLGEALGGPVDASKEGETVNVGGYFVRAPAVARFIRAFDAGEYPELVA